MKKLLAILLAAAMCFSLLAACGEKADPSDKDEKETKQDEQEEQEDKDDQDNEDPTTPTAEGETLETPLWTLIYDAEAWSYDEEYLYNDEDYACITLQIPDGEEYIVSLEVCASIEDAEGFRDDLIYYGFDQYEYAVEESYETVTVGGVDMLQYEGEYWGEPILRYFGRVEEASATVYVEITGETEDPQVAQLLSGLTFTLEDIENEDFPWAWDGEPFSGETKTAQIDSYTLTSQWLPLGDGVLTRDVFDHYVAADGNNAYILSDGLLLEYSIGADALELEAEAELDEEYESIASAGGSIWISGFMVPMVRLENGTQVSSYDDYDNVAIAPNGTWGINWFSGPECEKLTISGASISATGITFPEVNMISSLFVDNDHIYVCGDSADGSGHKVYVYNTDGILMLTLADENGENLGSITFMAKTNNGYIGFDGNMRDIILWSPVGDYIGDVSDGDLFGTNYPWFCSATLLDDGSILAIMTDDRADSSATELLAFRISGF